MQICPVFCIMENKKERVEAMFDAIAPRYDFLNHLLSLGIDRGWRSKLVKMLGREKPQRVLDVATGTGDLAMMIRQAGVPIVVGCDLSARMIAEGVRKVTSNRLDIELRKEDAEALSFDDGSFDAVTCAFGVRNFGDTLAGLGQMHRVLADNGKCYILEFSKVRRGSLWGWCYGLYFKRILPTVGRWISGDKGAYSYLPSSVEQFLCGEQFLDAMRTVGFLECEQRRLMGGVATIYSAKK